MREIFFFFNSEYDKEFHGKLIDTLRNIYEEATGQSFKVFEKRKSGKQNIIKFFDLLETKDRITKLNLILYITDEYYALCSDSTFSRAIGYGLSRASFDVERDIMQLCSEDLIKPHKLYKVKGVYFVELDNYWVKDFNFVEARKKFEDENFPVTTLPKSLKTLIETRDTLRATTRGKRLMKQNKSMKENDFQLDKVQ